MNRFVLPFLLFAAPALAQDRVPSHCIALADAGVPVHRVAFADPVAEGEVRIRYLDHASFALRTPQGKVLVTDYTGFIGGGDTVPDVVTMNNSHGTHWTATPDPRVPHVLQGWAADGIPAAHLKWSGKFRQRAKMYPALTTGYRNDDKTQFFGQVQGHGCA